MHLFIELNTLHPGAKEFVSTNKERWNDEDALFVLWISRS
jgi:hypothetical protein